MYGQHGKLLPLTKVTIMNRLISNLASVDPNMSCGSPTLPSLIGIRPVVVPPHGGEMYGSRPFLCFVCLFFHAREPILTPNSWKYVVWRKERPSKQVFFTIFTFRDNVLQKPHIFRRQYGNASQTKSEKWGDSSIIMEYAHSMPTPSPFTILNKIITAIA